MAQAAWDQELLRWSLRSVFTGEQPPVRPPILGGPAPGDWPPDEDDEAP